MIPVNEPLLTENEKKYLIECIETGWISSEGPFVKKFEESMAKYVGKKYGVAVSSGTAALEIAVKALGIGEGDEVIMPAFTIISCAQAIVKAGAKPVLVDCDYRTFNMKVEDIESKITEKTKAIMVVHIYGLSVDMEPVINIARRYALKIMVLRRPMWKYRFLIFLEKMRNSVSNIPQIIHFCRGRALSLPFFGQTRGSAPTLMKSTMKY